MSLPKGTHGVFTGQPTAAPWSIPTDDLIVKRKEWERLKAEVERLRKERRAIYEDSVNRGIADDNFRETAGRRARAALGEMGNQEGGRVNENPTHDPTHEPYAWLPSEAESHRVAPRECVAAARRALDKTYPLGQGQAAIPLLIEAVDWLRRALEQMAEETEAE